MYENDPIDKKYTLPMKTVALCINATCSLVLVCMSIYLYLLGLRFVNYFECMKQPDFKYDDGLTMMQTKKHAKFCKPFLPKAFLTLLLIM